MNEETGSTSEEEVPAPVRSFLLVAGLPAGLLLGLGSAYLLRRVGDNELYQREAAGTLLALKILKFFGFALAALCALGMLRDLLRRRKGSN
ncbi:MAG: hypothetical protein V4498_07580 [candidate division FCPU426 bacterium]